MKKTVIIALGGNALSPKKEAGTIEQQFEHTRKSLSAVMHIVEQLPLFLGLNLLIKLKLGFVGF